jgi:hypothetical protein
VHTIVVLKNKEITFSGCKIVALAKMVWISFQVVHLSKRKWIEASTYPHFIGMAIRVWIPDTRRVPDPIGTGMGMVFYPWVAPVPEPNRDGYRTGIFFHPRVTRWVPDTLLPL